MLAFPRRSVPPGTSTNNLSGKSCSSAVLPRASSDHHMPISDRTRKLLWGRSGNRCALCRNLLSADATHADPASVVGDECHIVARSPAGPRAGAISPEALDQEENLILLCKTDHKRVDDQPNYFTSERLRALKLAHETWVHTTLTPKPPQSPQPPQSFQAKLRPTDRSKWRLERIVNGSQAFALVAGALGYDFDHEELKDQKEVDLVGGFLQSMQDYGEADDDLESGGRVEARYELSQQIKALEENDFWVYGAQVPRIMEANGTPIKWPAAVVRVKRFSDFLLEMVKQVEAEEKEKTPADSQAPSEPTAAQQPPNQSSPEASASA